MKLPSEVIPKFIISLDKNKERQEYLKKEEDIVDHQKISQE